MINSVIQRRLMQTDLDFVAESGESDLELKIAAGVGCVIFAICVLFAIYGSVHKCRSTCIERKFRKWAPNEPDLEEFSKYKIQPGNRTPLLIAIQVNNEVLARKLMDKDPLFGLDRDDERGTPLHYAAKFGSLALVQSICERTDMQPAQDFHGNTALHYAASRSELSILNYLVRKYPGSQTIQNGSGASYLKCLAVSWKGHFEEALVNPNEFEPFIQQNRDIIPESLYVGLLAPYRNWGVEQLNIDIPEGLQDPLL